MTNPTHHHPADRIRHEARHYARPYGWLPVDVRVGPGQIVALCGGGHQVLIETDTVPAQVWDQVAAQLAERVSVAEQLAEALNSETSWAYRNLTETLWTALGEAVGPGGPQPMGTLTITCRCRRSSCQAIPHVLDSVATQMRFGLDLWTALLGLPVEAFTTRLRIPPMPTALIPLEGPGFVAEMYHGTGVLPRPRRIDAAAVDVLSVLGPAPEGVGAEKFTAALGAIYDQLAEKCADAGEVFDEPAEVADVAEPVSADVVSASAAEIRAWAREHGYVVGRRGVLSHAVKSAYAGAHPGR